MPKRRRVERARSARAAQPGRRATAASPPAGEGAARWRRLWPASLALALLALLWAARGPTLGVPVADDYSFLARLSFQHPLDPFDTMGAAYYWRPISRQLYFSLIGGRLAQAPWVAAGLHAVMLVAVAGALYAIARRWLSPPLAAAIATFPLLSESARVLLGWPSGAQHLLAATFALLAVNEALAGRAWTTLLAALAGVLSHELAGLALPLLPLAAWHRAHRTREAVRFGLIAAAVAAAWALGYAIALHHGVGLPTGAGKEHGIGIGTLLARVLAGPLDLEDQSPLLAHALIGGYLLVLAAAAVLGLRPGARRRIRRAWPMLAAGAAWFVLGSLPLALVPDWNAWRGWVPSLGLGVAATGFLGLASPALAGAFVGLRLVALLAAPGAPPVVVMAAPTTTSQLSFAGLSRLQRTVESTRRVLRAQHPDLPRGAALRYGWIPRIAQFGFQGQAAPRVWYRDSTITWKPLRAGERFDAMVEFINDVPWPAALLEPLAYRYFQQGAELLKAHRYREADSLMALAVRVHHQARGPFLASLLQNRARVAFDFHQFARADSINRICLALVDSDPDAWALEARLELVRNRTDAAIAALRRCLAIEPDHPEGRSLAAMLAAPRR